MEGSGSKGDRTRAALVGAAVKRFITEGFQHTSMTDVARDCGLTAAAVYRYFPSKEALFAAAVDAESTALVELARDALQDGHQTSMLSLLAGLADGLADAAEAHPLVGRVLTGREPLSPQAIVELPSLAELRIEIAGILHVGQTFGIVRPDLDPAVAALGLETVLLSYVASLVAQGAHGPSSSDERWTAVVALLEAALIPGPVPG